jgi:hypothetical protein
MNSILWEHIRAKQVLSDCAKEFRQILRIPNNLFDSIYTRVVNSWRPSFPMHPVHDNLPNGDVHQCRGAPPVPLKLKITTALRYMATGESMENVVSFVHGDKATLDLFTFFHDFSGGQHGEIQEDAAESGG